MLKIRKLQKGDAARIGQMRYDTIHAINKEHYSQEQLDVWAPKTNEHSYWDRAAQHNILYVAEIEGELVGFADFKKNGYISSLYVHKDHQSKGIATALYKKMEEEANHMRLKEFTVESSITAKPFFLRMGFTVVNSQDKEFNGMIFLNYIMSKKLRSSDEKPRFYR